ncbi:MAG: polysaccharide biosynthesis tyrosine autokinase [Verrucomicrobiota bacterium]
MEQQKTTVTQESKLHFLDYWRIIRIRKTIILAVFLLVVITATLVTFILPESYSGTARIRVERDAADIPAMTDRAMMPGSAYDPYFIQTEFEVLQSEVILGPVIDQLKLNEKWASKFGSGEKLKTSETMEILHKNMELRPVRNASVIQIQVYSDKAQEAADIANAIANTYRQHRLEQNREQMKNGIKALEEQWDELTTKIEAAQTNVDHLRSELKVSDPDPMNYMPTPTLSAEAVRQFTMQLITLETDQERQETQLRKLEQLSPEEQRQAVQTAIGPDTELGALLTEYNAANQRLISLEKDVTPENPVYITTKKMRDDLDDRINKRVRGILDGLQTRVDAGRAAIEGMKNKLDQSKQSDLEAADKGRPYYSAKQRLGELIQFKSVLAMKIAAQQTDLYLPRNSMVEIIDKAFKSDRPERPKKALNIALGIIIGLIVGVGLAFFIEYLDTSVKTIDDVERTLQSPVLGVIPQNVGLLLEEGAESPHAEAYRVLRTNLLFSRKDDNLNSIAIVSAGAGEGKSTTVFNLATIFAQNGHRVVIVDSDLRRPVLHKLLRVTNSIGVTNYLLKQNTLEQVIQTTSLPTLDFMASGKLPSSSLGILSSGAMRDLINELKKRYDFVFFDSPPIMGVSDASILASVVDMTIQVIQYRRYPQPMNIRAKQMIEKVGGNLVGIVLNNINMSQDENYYYYSGYYHEYYAKNEDSVPAGAPEGEGAAEGKIEIKPKY